MTAQTEKRLKEGKSLGGRKSLYDPKYCEEIIKFFDIEPYYEAVVKTITKPSGEVIKEMGLRPNKLPLLSQFAHSINVSTDALNDWVKHHEEFSLSYKKAKQLQENLIIHMGMSRVTDCAFTIFTAHNITTLRNQPTTVIDQSKHTHYTSVNVENLKENELVDLLTGRTNGNIGKPA